MALCATEAPGSFSIITLPCLACSSYSQSKMTYYYITPQSAGRHSRGTRYISLFFKDMSQKLYALLSLMYNWSAFSHVATSPCKGNHMASLRSGGSSLSSVSCGLIMMHLCMVFLHIYPAGDLLSILILILLSFFCQTLEHFTYYFFKQFFS